MHKIDDSDDSSDETNEGADNGDTDLEETPSESDFEPECPKEVNGGKVPVKHQEKPQRDRQSSGSGRSKERMQMDLLNQEIKELEEQCKFLGSQFVFNSVYFWWYKVLMEVLPCSKIEPIPPKVGWHRGQEYSSQNASR